MKLILLLRLFVMIYTCREYSIWLNISLSFMWIVITKAIFKQVIPR